MKSRNLLLGVIILFVGVVALLVSLDVVDFSWRIAAKLWPLLFVFVGVMVLPVKDWLKALLLLATLFVGVLLYQYEYSRSGFHWLFSQAGMGQIEAIVEQVLKS